MNDLSHWTGHERSRRRNKRVIQRSALALMMCLLAMGTVAGELTLITPPSNPSFKRALPLLSAYLSEKLHDVSAIRPTISNSYRETGQRFESNHMSLAYGGSFLTYVLCARDLAVPLARGENSEGISTYQSVLLTKKVEPFRGLESVKGRRLAYVFEASAGGIFARRFFGGKAPDSVADSVYVPAKSHGIAVRLVQADRADFAFVKDLAWEAVKTSYPDLHVVARDTGEHPNNVLVLSSASYHTYGKRIESILLNMDSDPDRRARRILDALGLKRFIPTTYPGDYAYTASLVRDAGLDPSTFRFAD